jgi:SAM-dependent methyltransferase
VDGPWELEAENWVRWARTPGHDAYWDYAPVFFDEIVPAAGRLTLELGCGEGRVVRDLTARGHRAVGLDASPTLLAHARGADPSGRYVLADAARVPFADGAFDLVVAYNSLMNIEGMEAAVREAARVLETNGRLCVCVTHPVNDAGAFASREPDASFVIDGSYLGKRPFEGTFERDGLEITFRGWVYPLEAYGRALEDAGFVIEAIREPPATAAAVERDPPERRWQRLPAFLFLRAIKR